MIANVGSTGDQVLMKVQTAVLFLLAAGCSQATRQPPHDSKPILLNVAAQDIRCRGGVANGLKPGSFKYGVISTPAAAKTTAITYFKAVFDGTDVPLDALLRRGVKVELHDGVWRVSMPLPEGAIGLYVFADICQSDGRVLALSGGQ